MVEETCVQAKTIGLAQVTSNFLTCPIHEIVARKRAKYQKATLTRFCFHDASLDYNNNNIKKILFAATKWREEESLCDFQRRGVFTFFTTDNNGFTSFIGISSFVTFSAILRLIPDSSVVTGRGDWSTRQKPPLSPGHWQLSHMPKVRPTTMGRENNKNSFAPINEKERKQ